MRLFRQKARPDPGVSARPDPGVSEAKKRYCEFVSKKTSWYEQDRESTDPRLRDGAYFNLGMALHAVMDSTSPTHRGFQYWSFSAAPRHGPFWTSHETDDIAKKYLAETWMRINYAITNGQSIECGCS